MFTKRTARSLAKMLRFGFFASLIAGMTLGFLAPTTVRAEPAYAKSIAHETWARMGTVLPDGLTDADAGWWATVQQGIHQQTAAAVDPVTVNGLASTPDWTADGSQAGDQFARVSGGGDVNGDGYADVIVGTSVNRAYLYLGSQAGLSLTPAMTLTGEAEGVYFGYRATIAGDVDGDGYSDLIVPDIGYGANQGRVYLYLGGAAGLSATSTLTLTGEMAGDNFGVIGAPGDVNGDGYADIAIGAVAYPSGTYQGRVYLYLGGPAGLSATPALTLTGEMVGDYFGGSVNSAGDINGDGYSDVIIGAYNYDNGLGKIYVYHGGPGGLSATPAFTDIGVAGSIQSRNSRLGTSVGSAGDVNGDGYADIIVGEQYYSISHQEGRVRVYLGDHAGLDSTPVYVAVGETQMSYLGISVGTAGDVNGDGYSDMIFGAHGYPSNNRYGRVYVYLGGPDGPAASPAFIYTGTAANQFTGSAVGTAGDVDGDGYGDILFGANGYNSYTGRAYAFYGAPDTLAASPSWTADGSQAGDYFGKRVSGGDVNGDGYGDVMISNHINQAYLYLGSQAGLSVTPTLTLTGEAEGLYFGSSVTLAGDVDGDGYSDLIIADNSYPNSEYQGRVYLYLGGAAGLSATPTLTLTGETTGDYFGTVGAPGDVNGDGYADIAIGAVAYPSGTYQGRVYLYLGGPAGLSATPALTLTGETAGDQFGNSVGTAGDINGDGYSDVIIGAHVYGSGLGKIYVYHGSASGLSATPAFTDVGVAGSIPSRNSRLGTSVGTAGDVNGDGYADIIVGEQYYSISHQEGRVRVYLGGPSGLDSTPVYVAVGETQMSYLGYSVGTAGDVNGDGYSDMIFSALGYPNNARYGRIYVYLGGPDGPATSPAFTYTGQTAQYTGISVGTAGDVDGDGYGDILFGAYAYNSNTGRTYAFYGNGGGGLSMLPRQVRSDGSAPVAHLGMSDSHAAFQLSLIGRMPLGRAEVRLQWQAAPLGVPITSTSVLSGTSGWTDVLTTGVEITQTVTGLTPDTPYHWRVRLLYEPGNALGQAASRWITIPINGWNETDLRTPPNQPPVADDQPISTDEDTAYTGALTASDPDDDPLAFALDTAPLHGLVSIALDGSFTYTPTQDYHGTDVFTFTVSDGEFSDLGRVDITVTPVNDAPAAEDDSGAGFATDEDTPFTTGNVLDNDWDVDLSDTLAVDSYDDSGLLGLLTGNGDGTFDYDPNGQFDYLAEAESFLDIFTYVVTDGTLTDTATVTITINGINDAPVAVGDEYVTDEDVPLVVPAPGVLGNDTDVDGDALSAAVDVLPVVGSLALNPDGGFTYTPPLNFNGEITFTYIVSDSALTDTGQVTITVTPVNDAPNVDAGEDVDTFEGDLVQFNGTYSDPGLMNIQAFTLTWDFGDGFTTTGTLTPTHTYADDGIFTVTLTVEDGEGGVGADTLLVTVENAAPVLEPIANQSIRVREVLTLTAAYSDPGVLDTHRATIVWGDGYTTTIDLEAGLTGFDFAHAFNAAGAYTVTVTLTDDDGGSDTITFQVIVESSGYKIFLPTIVKK